MLSLRSQSVSLFVVAKYFIGVLRVKDTPLEVIGLAENFSLLTELLLIV